MDDKQAQAIPECSLSSPQRRTGAFSYLNVNRGAHTHLASALSLLSFILSCSAYTPFRGGGIIKGSPYLLPHIILQWVIIQARLSYTLYSMGTGQKERPIQMLHALIKLVLKWCVIRLHLKEPTLFRHDPKWPKFTPTEKKHTCRCTMCHCSISSRCRKEQQITLKLFSKNGRKVIKPDSFVSEINFKVPFSSAAPTIKHSVANWAINRQKITIF